MIVNFVSLTYKAFTQKIKRIHFIPICHFQNCQFRMDLKCLFGLNTFVQSKIYLQKGFEVETQQPQVFTQSEPNNLVRDLGLPKDAVQILGSMLQHKHLRTSETSFTCGTEIAKNILCLMFPEKGL